MLNEMMQWAAKYDDDDFMFLTEECQSDKGILLKCNPDFWDWSDDALDHYKTIFFINFL
jgi:hypothetical protein